MSETQNPADRDRPVPEDPPESSGEAVVRTVEQETSVWTIVGIVVLMAIAAGAIAGFLGGRIFEYNRPPDDEVLRLLGAVPVDSGDSVILTQMQTGGAANSVGLMEGDVLLSLDGERITSAAQASRIIASHNIGDRVLVAYQHNFRSDQVVVILGFSATPFPTPVVAQPTRTPVPTSSGQQQQPPNWSGRAALGITYDAIHPIEPGLGAFVTFVEENTPAYAAGIVSGDTITAIDGYRVNDSDRSLDIVLRRFNPGQRVTLTILREGEEIQIALFLGS